MMEMTLALHPCKTNIFLKMFKAPINTSNADTTSVYDDLIVHDELEQLLTQNESTVKLKKNEVIPLTKFVVMNKNRFA